MRRRVVVPALLAVAVLLPGASPEARAPAGQDRAGGVAAEAGADARSPAVPGPSPRNANYVIDARLDVKSHRLSATEDITWRNVTTHPTSEVRLHLYFNAWAHDKTSYALANRLGPIPWSLLLMDHRPGDWGYCDITSLSVLPADGGPEVPAQTEFIQPNDGNVDDRTVLRVALPRPVPPGGTVRLKVAWEAKVPRPFQRAGVRGEYFLMGQWFPKVGVFEPDGSWNCHQFIQTEFYADFGVYDVTLRVPAGWVVGATGRRAGARQEADGVVAHRFQAEDVHDFAWTTSPHFTVHAARFESPGLPPVELELLLLPDHASLKDRYLDGAKRALEAYGRWFRPYPWDRLTIVDPPYRSLTDSMEYPMFVTGGSRWLTSPRNRYTEADTIHEVGHEWWYGVVANNEMEDAWLDEGVNTYAHKRVLDQAYPPKTYDKRYFHDFLPLEFPSVRIAQNMHGADEADGFRSVLKREPLSTPSWRAEEGMYYILPYGKGGLVLVTLERYLGWETWRRVMATYAGRFWFGHPKPADFFATVKDVTGQDFGWYFDQAWGTSNLFDYAAGRVDCRPDRPPRGYADAGRASRWQEPAGTGAPAFACTVDIRRWGEGIFPVETRVTFADGTSATERWDGAARWTRYRYLRRARVVRVEVDPARTLVLDVNSANNSWTSAPRAGEASVKWTSKWIVWLQSVMELMAFFS